VFKIAAMVRSTSLGLAALYFAGAALAVPPCDPQKLVVLERAWNELIRTGELRRFNFAMGPDLVYKENDKTLDIRKGITSKALDVSANRAFYDTTLCKIFAEHVVTNPEHPYVINAQVYVVDGRVSELDVLVTDKGDFTFNATTYQAIGYSQKWGLIPKSERSTREYLKDAGDAYLEHLHSRAPFPVRAPCMILSSGYDSSKGNDTVDACTHEPYKPGDPIQTMHNRRYLIDEVCIDWLKMLSLLISCDQSFGVVNIFTLFTGLDKNLTAALIPDSHLFRLENGKIRYIHLAAACINPNCGWDDSWGDN